MTKVLEEKFETYHKENPQLYKLFERFAREALSSGYKTFSAYAIFERIRWHVAIETVGDPFKLNNNYRPYYARKLMFDQPEFEGFFNTRSLQE